MFHFKSQKNLTSDYNKDYVSDINCSKLSSPRHNCNNKWFVMALRNAYYNIYELLFMMYLGHAGDDRN